MQMVHQMRIFQKLKLSLIAHTTATPRLSGCQQANNSSELMSSSKNLKRTISQLRNLRILDIDALSLSLASTIVSSCGSHHALNATGLLLHMVADTNVPVDVHAQRLSQSIVCLLLAPMELVPLNLFFLEE